jgi:hypothetical protein
MRKRTGRIIFLIQKKLAPLSTGIANCGFSRVRMARAPALQRFSLPFP